jgi:hypothetical protein
MDTMAINTVKFLSIAFTALALVPSGAHSMEFVNKIRLPAESYLTVQGIYRGWALSGILVAAALVSTIALAFVLRGQQGFVEALIAALCIAGTQIVFWSRTYPVNTATHNWTLLTDNWQELRARWEYSHIASALLNLGALFAAIVAALRS